MLWVGLALILMAILFVFDIVILYSKKGIKANRALPQKFSNGDDNPVYVNMENNYSFDVDLKLIDEIPVQFQRRDFNIQTKIL